MGGDYIASRKELPTLLVTGKNDNLYESIQEDFVYIQNNWYKGYLDVYTHKGKHELPPVTEQLQSKIRALVQFAGVGLSEER